MEINYLEVVGRYVGLTEEQAKQRLYLEKGIYGENQFVKFLCSSNCVKLNVYFEHFGASEVDVLVVLPNQLLHFEVKYYEGAYRIDEYGQWWCDQYVLKNNPLDQVKKTHQHLKNIVKKARLDVEVQSFLVLANPFLYVETQHVSLMHLVLNYCNLKKFCEEINEHIERAEYVSEQCEWIWERLEKYTSEYRVTIERNENFTVHSGLVCPVCNSREMIEKTQRKIACVCGHDARTCEWLDQAIHDYCLLFPMEPFSARDIYQFVDGEFNYRYIYRYLLKNYTLERPGRPNYYKNPYQNKLLIVPPRNR